MSPDPPAEVLTGVRRAARRDAPAGTIDGVVVERLSPFADHRGSLAVFLDVSRPFWSEPIVYGYQFTIEPGRIKGWGMHERQVDRYVVTNGRVRVALFDGRDGSPTAGATMDLHLGERVPALVRIPTGVWHADQNYGDTVARLVNFPTVAYDPANPDKQRIDPHSGVIPFSWDLPDG